MSMRELQHLGEKLDVDQAAAPFLQVEARFVFAGELTLHAHAQVMNLADPLSVEPGAVGEFLGNLLGFLAECWIASDAAGFDQCLTFPELRGGAMIVAISVQGADDWPRFA